MKTKSAKNFVTAKQLETEVINGVTLGFRALLKQLPAYMESRYGLVLNRSSTSDSSPPAADSNDSSKELPILNAERVRELTQMSKDPNEAHELHVRGFRSERNQDGSFRWFRRLPMKGEVIRRAMNLPLASGQLTPSSAKNVTADALHTHRLKVHKEIVDARMRGLKLTQPRI